jgi:hypothetical protein
MWSFPHFDSSVDLRHSSWEDSNGQTAANPQAATAFSLSLHVCRLDQTGEFSAELQLPVARR